MTDFLVTMPPFTWTIAYHPPRHHKNRTKYKRCPYVKCVAGADFRQQR